jgi:hypothetical protein
MDDGRLSRCSPEKLIESPDSESGVVGGLEGRSDKISIPGGDIGLSHMCCQHGCRVQIPITGTASEAAS